MASRAAAPRRRDAAVLRDPPAGGKLASQVADRIVDDVIAAGWPVGDVLGSEAELTDRYGISRAVFREAVRLIEHQQVARMRRGPGGGLVITEPTVEAITGATILYLHRVDARLDEVFEARVVVEELVVAKVADHLSETTIAQLREQVQRERASEVRDPRSLHSILAAATGNPAFELFVELLNEMALLYMSDRTELTPKVWAESGHAHAKVVEAIIKGDGNLAKRRMRRHLEAEGDYLRRRRSTRQYLPTVGDLGLGGKRAQEVAGEIFQGVTSGRLKPGDAIGSESDLLERYGVSRAIVREAVRLLEHHHLAAMRRGPGGGLFVTEPSAEAVTDVVAIYLERQGISVAEIFEVRAGIELTVVDLAIDNLDEIGLGQLRTSLAEEAAAPAENFTTAAHDLHAVLASVAGNRVLELIALVLIRLTRLHEVGTLSPRARAKVGAEVTHTHTAIADALAARDRDLARHRMDRHMKALAGFFR